MAEADQGSKELGEEHAKTKSISAFLHEGGTWNRFKHIAVTPVAQGGLELFLDETPEYMHVFGTGSPINMHERPDTTCAL